MPNEIPKPISVPTESRPTDIDWAERAAERIHLLYRDANYFKSMPKAPLIEGWTEIIRTEFFKGTAPSVTTSMNSASLPTANLAEDSEVRHLPDEEWNRLSRESREKINKWFHLASERLQLIIDSEEIAERITCKIQSLLTDKYENTFKIACRIIGQELSEGPHRPECKSAAGFPKKPPCRQVT